MFLNINTIIFLKRGGKEAGKKGKKDIKE